MYTHTHIKYKKHLHSYTHIETSYNYIGYNNVSTYTHSHLQTNNHPYIGNMCAHTQSCVCSIIVKISLTYNNTNIMHTPIDFGTQAYLDNLCDNLKKEPSLVISTNLSSLV